METGDAKGDDRLVTLMRSLPGAKVYFSGRGGAEYQDEVKFSDAGFELAYTGFHALSSYRNPKHHCPGLSVVDAVFNVGWDETRNPDRGLAFCVDCPEEGETFGCVGVGRFNSMTAKSAFVMPSFAGGGAERVMIGLANGVDRSAYSPVLLTLTDGGRCASSAADAEIVSLGCPHLRSAFGPLRRAIKGLRPDVVASTMGYLNIGVL